MTRKILVLLALAFGSQMKAQVDTSATEDDFDFSDFELAAEPAKSFCNNKVLLQSPTSLIGVFYNYQGGHDLYSLPESSAFGSLLANNDELDDTARISNGQQISLVGNFPLISRNNILINLGLTYQQQRYTVENGAGMGSFGAGLSDAMLQRANATFTVFKPLNERNFILAQAQVEINSDQYFNGTPRFPVAVLYGWKPSDRLMYAFGLSQTYLGGALNYVPIIYYYHTFKNQKWGVEALLPARAMLRYRFDALSYMGLGWNVVGASYNLDAYDGVLNQSLTGPAVPQESRDLELRRSAIRAGLSYSRQLTGFFWFSVEAGYRINYNFSIDQGGDKVRFFGNEDPYFLENFQGNAPYFTIGLSYVSP